MPIRARIALCLEHFGFVRRRLASESILEKTYQVVGGSIRTHDYDDAWILALGFDSRVVLTSAATLVNRRYCCCTPIASSRRC